jgi:proliferating cell nuclear antigen
MFKAVAKDSRLLRDCIDTISQLIDDGIFKLRNDGIELIASDRAMVSVVDFKLKSSAFDEYECEPSKEIGLNLLNLLTVLKRANPEDKLSLSLNEKENKLQITMHGNSVRHFSIPLIEISKEEIPPIDKLDFQSSAEIRSDVFEEGIIDANIVADSVVIELDENKLSMHSEGNSSKAELSIEKGTAGLFDVSAKTKSKSRYSLEYLKKMIRGANIADKIKLHSGNDYPLKLEFKNDQASLSIILAPRVSED